MHVQSFMNVFAMIFFTNENGDKNTNDKHFLILNESV